MTPRPNAAQRVRYLLGRPLPPTMRDWVIRDQTGPGNLVRYAVRGQAMVAPFYIMFFAFPGELMLKLYMVALVFSPVALMQAALREVYRKHLLVSNDIDDSVIAVARLTREVHRHDTYQRLLHHNPH